MKLGITVSLSERLGKATDPFGKHDLDSTTRTIASSIASSLAFSMDPLKSDGLWPITKRQRSTTTDCSFKNIEAIQFSSEPGTGIVCSSPNEGFSGGVIGLMGRIGAGFSSNTSKIPQLRRVRDK